MEGPMEDAVGGAEGESQSKRGADTASRGGGRPGGKAFERLLYFLEERGDAYVDLAAATVEAVVPENQARGLLTESRPNSALPVGGPKRASYKPEQPAREKTRAGAKEEEPAPSAETEAGEAIAREVMSAAVPASPPTPTGPQWRSLGPWTIPNGQTYGASRVNVSGRVSSIAIDRNNSQHILVGAANGGVWETFDRGASWAPRTDYAATLAVGVVVFDPQNSAVAYCGTGEGDWWSFLGQGILRSTNGGATWTTLCTAPFVGQGFYSLIVNPATNTHLLAGTTGGLYTSTDGGVNWTLRRSQRTWSVAMAPAGGAGAEILAACADGLFRSVNGGVTWAAVALPGSGAFDRLAVAIARTNPAVAYAWGSVGGAARLWRRAGGVWTSVAPPPGVSTGQAWYDWFLGIAWDTENQIYCGAIEVHRGDLSGTTWTWRNITNKGTSGDSIHPDQHAIAVDPTQPNAIFVGNDGGLYRSPDRGITWAHCNNGLQISEFEYLAQNFGSSRWILGGTQDNGTQRYTGSSTWDHVADGDGGDCGVNRTNPNTVFHTYFNMSPERSTTGGNFGSWTWLPPPIPSGEGSLFYPPFECSSSAGDTVAIGGDALYVSRNNMTTWTRITFPVVSRSSALYIPNANTVYVGATNGRIFRTTWNGTAWTALASLTTPRAGAVMSDILVDPNNANRIWVTYRTVGGGRVYRSDNAAVAWVDCTATLPNLPMNAIEVDPGNANLSLVAADLGVYQTLNGGTSWTNFSSSLPNAYIGDIVFHPHARVLRAGLRNRGVWEIPVDGWMTTPICATQWTGSLAGNQTQRWFTWGWPATWHMVWTVMPTNPQPGNPQVTWKVQVERANAEFVTYWITVQNLTTNPVTFDGRYCILSRY